MKKRFALLLACCATAHAFANPQEVQAEYQVSSNGVNIGKVQETYARKGSTYSIQSTTRTEGPLKVFFDDTIVIESEGRVSRAGLQPETFRQKRHGNSSRDIHASFDWKKGVMHSQYRGESADHPLPEGTQDRLSVLYQFMNVAPRGDTIEMHMSNGRKVELYTYRKVEDVKIKTPAGDFDTVHYARVTQDPKKSKAEIWLAKDRHHLPVRIVFDDPKGLRVEQNLTALKTQ